MAAETAACTSVQQGLQREGGRGTLKQGRETWFIWNYCSRPRSAYPSPIDGQRKTADWKRLEAGSYQSAYIRRVNDDKREETGKQQGCDQLKEPTNHEWTEIRHAKNKKTANNIQECFAIAAHACL
jgi:hypothetical protein